MNYYDPYEIVWISDEYLSKDKKNIYRTISIKNLKTGKTKNTYVVPSRVVSGRPFNNYKNWKRIVDNFDQERKLVWHFEPYMEVNGKHEKWGPDSKNNINADSIIYSNKVTVEDYKKSVFDEQPQEPFGNGLFDIT